MSTVYTFNNKVLKNSATDKWLAKKEIPMEVQIGNQIWKTKNLAIDDGLGGIYTQTVNYGQGDVVEYYYTWDAAVRVAASISGWHLPTKTEWDTLITTAGGDSIAGTKLKSTYGWIDNGNGTDDYGFTILPAGDWSPYSGPIDFGRYAYFWSATENSSSAYCTNITKFNGMITTWGTESKTYSMSLRLVKD